MSRVLNDDELILPIRLLGLFADELNDNSRLFLSQNLNIVALF